MSWRVRHEGSPQPVEGLSLEEVLQGLADGNWEPTDEVMGPNDSSWTKLENHPQFAEVASELEPPPPRTYGDEDAHVDMNALIDVCMVLLIFFILTMSYSSLQKRLRSPDVARKSDDKAVRVRVVDKKEVEQTILVTVEMETGKPVIFIEGNRVAPGDVEDELKKIVRNSKKTTLTLSVDPKVPSGTSLPIQAAASAAGVIKLNRAVRN
jgi:biopolymer transport protein ExbD